MKFIFHCVSTTTLFLILFSYANLFCSFFLLTNKDKSDADHLSSLKKVLGNPTNISLHQHHLYPLRQISSLPTYVESIFHLMNNPLAFQNSRLLYYIHKMHPNLSQVQKVKAFFARESKIISSIEEDISREEAISQFKFNARNISVFEASDIELVLHLAQFQNQRNLGSRSSLKVQIAFSCVEYNQSIPRKTRSHTFETSVSESTANIFVVNLKKWITFNFTEVIVSLDSILLPPEEILKEEHNHSNNPSTPQTLLIFYFEKCENESALKDKSSTSLRQKIEHLIPMKMKRSMDRHYCGLHPWYVDFEKIGWTDWVWSPTGYNASYCLGDCIVYNEHFNSTSHAYVRDLLLMMQSDRNRSIPPKPCCVPISYEPLSIVYYEGEDIVIRSLSDMIAKTCGCS